MFAITVCFTIFVFLVVMVGVTAFSDDEPLVHTILWRTTKITFLVVAFILACIWILL